MIEKRYHNDWAKSKSRDLVKEVISRTLLKFRKPKQMKVLCFPGIDATEIFEVYDELGIPRKNITGVERDKEVVRELEKKSLGIKIIPKTLEDFVEEQNSFDFDIVSLDYTGPLNNTHLENIEKICKNQEKNNFVLHHVNLLRRDKVSQPYYSTGEIHFNRKTNQKFASFIEQAKYYKENYGGEKREIPKEKKFRGYSVTIRARTTGKIDGILDKMFKFVAGENQEKLMNNIERKLEIHFGIKKKLNMDCPLEGLGVHSFNPGIIRLFEEVILENLGEDLKNFSWYSTKVKISVFAALNDAIRPKKYFFERDLEAYTYISESGSPMIGNIAFLGFPYKSRLTSEEIAYEMGYPHQIKIKDPSKLKKLLNQNAIQNREFRSKEILASLNEKTFNQQFLGNSSRPILTKRRAIEEFEKGVTVEELLERYRGTSNKPLAQWKAHVTMGTYDKRTEINGDESDIEKITKEEAYDLLSSGIPPKEVYETYPTSFSIGTLRAYKKWVTMRED